MAGRSDDLAQPLKEALALLADKTEWLVQQKDLNDRFAGAAAYLKAYARMLGAYCHYRAYVCDHGQGARAKLATFYINTLLPEHIALLAQATQGAKDLYALTVEDLVA